MLGTQGWQKIVDDPVNMSDGAEEMSEDQLHAINWLVHGVLQISTRGSCS